jgi:hypothetical protein
MEIQVGSHHCRQSGLVALPVACNRFRLRHAAIYKCHARLSLFRAGAVG